MVNITEHFDYNAPVDNENVAYLIFAEHPRSTKPAIKAFKVAPGIWMTPTRQPEVFDMNPNYNRPSDLKESKFQIYDPDYNLSNENKSLFLKRMTILFQRLNKKDTTSHLLELLGREPVYASPERNRSSSLVETFGAAYMVRDQKNFALSQENLVGKIPVNVMIYGPSANLAKPFTGYSPSSGHPFLNGTVANIAFAPDVAFAPHRSGSKTVPLFDPALGLAHELTHALRINYGYIYPSYEEAKNMPQYKKIKSNPEEDITFEGGNERTAEIVKNKKQLLKVELEKISREIKSYESKNPELFQAMKNRFFFDNMSLEVTDYQVMKLHGLLTHNFNEQKMAIELQTPTRESYAERFINAKFYIDVSNPKHYSVERGINRETFHPEVHNSMVNPVSTLFCGVGGRSKREAEEPKKTKSEGNNCIPLEPRHIGSNSKDVQDVSAKSRVKRQAQNCLTIEEYIEKTRNLRERIQDLPEKVIGKFQNPNDKIKNDKNADEVSKKIYEEIKRKTKQDIEEVRVLLEQHKTQIKNNIIEVQSSEIERIKNIVTENSSPNKSTVETEIHKLVTTKENRLTLNEYVDAHRVNGNLDIKKDYIEFYHPEDISSKAQSKVAIEKLCLECGNKSFTNSKRLRTHMKGAKVALGNIEVGLNIYLWAETVIDDFMDDTRPEKFHTPGNDAIHKANDILQIIPYIGVVSNIAVDVYDGEWSKLALDVGLFALLYACPELGLPIMLLGILHSWLTEKDRQNKKREFIRNAIINMLEQEDDFIDKNALEKEKHFANAVFKKVELLAHGIVEQMLHNYNAMIHNIAHIVHNKKLTYNERDTLEENLAKKTREFHKHLDKVYQSICKTMFRQLRTTFIEDYKKISLKQMESISEETQEALKEMLSEKDPAINEEFVKESMETINQYIKKHDIHKKLDVQIKDLQVLLENQDIKTERLHMEAEAITVEEGKIKVVNPNNVTTKNIKLVNQMFNGAYLFDSEKNSAIEMKDPLLNVRGSYSIGFWLKIPMPYLKKDKDTMRILKDKYGDDGLHVEVRGNNLLHVTYSNHMNDIRPIELEYCMWHYIFITYNHISRTLSVYKDGVLEVHHGGQDKSLGGNLVIGMDNKGSMKHYTMSNFEYYYTYFNDLEVEDKYKEEKPDGFLYDMTGEPLRKQKKYILISRQLEIHEVDRSGIYLMVNHQKTQRWHSFIDRVFDRAGLEITFENLKEGDMFIRRDDIVKIKNENIALSLNDQSLKEFHNDMVFYDNGKELDRLRLFQANNGIYIATVKDNSIYGILVASRANPEAPELTKMYSNMGINSAKSPNGNINKYNNMLSKNIKICSAKIVNASVNVNADTILLNETALKDNNIRYDDYTFNFHPVDEDYNYKDWNFNAKK